MAFFLAVLLKLAPLYFNMALGYAAGRLLKISRDDLAGILFYLINPIVIFNGILYTQISESILLLPVFIFAICCFLCFIFYGIASFFWKDSTRNLVALSAGYGNAGYFGLPLALLFFDNQGEGIYMMALMGMVFYENTLGFYICAKGSYTAKECLQKLIRLPTLYAFLAALIFNLMQLPIPVVFTDFMCHIKGTYIVLGMMIIGISLAGLKSFAVDGKFITITFLAKFLAWPAIALGFIYLDLHFLQIYDPIVHQALILLSIVPIAVSTVVIALVLKQHPDKVSMALLLSALFALVFVPIMVAIFIPDARARFQC